jgi:hypothetical protein
MHRSILFASAIGKWFFALTIKDNYVILAEVVRIPDPVRHPD